MSEKYDCTKDVMQHKEMVASWLHNFASLLKGRAETHDNSKLKDPIEKAMFDEWTPELRTRTFGTDHYKQALDAMGEGVKLHYKANRHHPEHYENGVNGMTLVDLVEMVCDWMAAAQKRNAYVDLNHATERFGLSPQLVDIIANTLREQDFWNEIEGVPCVYLCPPDRRDGKVDQT